nr:TonB-dependent receptor [Pseudomonas duriflava]
MQGWAQEVQDATSVTEHMTIYGQADSLDKALQEQRDSDSVESVVHADSIGQLPDDNAAEALQRVPGVSTERDQGESRFVRVRGLGPDLNSVTINGTLVPAPESDRRAVALDVLPSELIQSMSVIKTLTPDMDANSLGGTIEIESLSAFDHDDLFYSLTAQTSYDENQNRFSPKYSGAISQRFSLGEGFDNFGVAAALSWQDRHFGSDNVETGGDWDFDNGNRLEGFEQRDYVISRERAGGAVNFDYRPDDDTSYYLRTLYSRFKDTETRNATVFSFEDALAEGETGETVISRELKDRTETQNIQSYVLGGERQLENWTVKAQAGYSQAEERTPLHTDSASFISDALDAGFYDGEQPHAVSSTTALASSNYTLDEIERSRSYTSDTEKNIRLDLAYDYAMAGYDSQVKFGGKLSRRTKKNDTDVWSYEDLSDYGLTDDALSLSNFQGSTLDYALGADRYGIDSDAVNGVIARLNAGDFYDEEESLINDFTMHEDINAAYVMNTVDIGDWRLIGGVRYEGTDFQARGTGIIDGTFQSIDRQRRYHHWLPGLHAQYQLDEDTKVRAAWTNTVVRPTFGQLAPGFVIDDDEAEFGNPDLSPLESSNLDLAIERYMGHASVISAALFYKDIKSFIYNTDLAGSGAYADFSEAATYANGDKAEVYGLELAYSQKMTMLPAPWDGLLLGANATFSRSSADIEDAQGNRRSISLPSQSDVTGNLMVGYEKDKVSLRLTGNYKSDYLYEVGNVSDKRYDTYVDDQFFVDFSARYFLTDNLQVFFEAQNLTDQPYYVFQDEHRYNYQYEEYGRTFTVGLTLTHF